jgi:hypothetical protein
MAESAVSKIEKLEGSVLLKGHLEERLRMYRNLMCTAFRYRDGVGGEYHKAC